MEKIHSRQRSFEEKFKKGLEENSGKERITSLRNKLDLEHLNKSVDQKISRIK